MKILVATEKAFAPAAVEQIREVVNGWQVMNLFYLRIIKVLRN